MENGIEKEVEGGSTAEAEGLVTESTAGEVTPTGVAGESVSSGAGITDNDTLSAVKAKMLVPKPDGDEVPEKIADEKSETLADLNELESTESGNAGVAPADIVKEPADLDDESDLENLIPKGEDPGPEKDEPKAEFEPKQSIGVFTARVISVEPPKSIKRASGTDMLPGKITIEVPAAEWVALEIDKTYEVIVSPGD
jgi:hypothetical protein